jgi:hypothetical protein
MKRISVLLIVLCFLMVGCGEKHQYNKAKKENTFESYNRFIKEFPDSKYINEFKDKILTIEYEKAKKEANEKSYNAFLQKYPNSRYSEEINNLLYPYQRNYKGEKIAIIVAKRAKQWQMGLDSINAKKGNELITFDVKGHIDFSPVKLYDINNNSYKVEFKRFAMSFSENNTIEKFTIYGFSIPQNAEIKKLQLGEIDFDLRNIEMNRKYN